MPVSFLSSFLRNSLIEIALLAPFIDELLKLLNKLMYKKPYAYLDELCQVLSIESTALQERWKTFVEAKARRDLGVHAAWRCNDVFLRKLKEADVISKAKVGDLMLPRDQLYLNSTMTILNQLATEITTKVLEIHWPEIDRGKVNFGLDSN